MRVIYSPKYNIWSYGLNAGHPFDTCRAGNAWKLLEKSLRSNLANISLPVRQPIVAQALLAVHSAEYLTALRTPKKVAAIVELPRLAAVPSWLLDRLLLRPMRWAVAGSLLAAEAALANGLAFNLAGGFHHAKPSQGEGFCFYSDIAMIVTHLRRQGLLTAEDRVAYVDLDVHQGNGVCHCFLEDSRLFVLDMFNTEIYPCSDEVGRSRIDCPIEIQPGTTGTEYLERLRDALPPFLDSISRSGRVGLAIFNAGTDVHRDDPLGGLNLTDDDVLERDLYVVKELRNRDFPTVVLPSGGYTSHSAQLIANTVTQLAEG